MQRNTMGILVLLAFAVVLAAATVQAQTRLIASVPFDFSLGQQSMAAGKYEVGYMSELVAVVRNADTGVSQLLIRSEHVQAYRVQRAKLVFNKYGHQYFLSEIWDGNSNMGIYLPKSKREKEVSLAGNQSSASSEMVIVAMN